MRQIYLFAICGQTVSTVIHRYELPVSDEALLRDEFGEEGLKFRVAARRHFEVPDSLPDLERAIESMATPGGGFVTVIDSAAHMMFEEGVKFAERRAATAPV